MKRFKNIAISVVAVAALSLLGCVNQDELSQKLVVEGEGAKVKLKFISPEPARVSSRVALDDAEEPKINNLQVLIVNKFGAVVTNQYFSTPPQPVDIETISGSNMKIYVLANAGGRTDVDLLSELAAVTSEAALKEIIKSLSPGNVIARDMLFATGVAGVDIHPGNINTIPAIQLFYVSSRVDFTVVDATPIGDKFEAVSWDVVNVPVKSYVIGRANDAVSNSEAGDFHYTEGSYIFDDVTTPSQWKSSFYTFENRQGGRVANAGTPPAGYTPGAIDSFDDKDKFWYAPAKATYILISGLYTQGGKTSAQSMKIHIGKDNHSNYDVERGKRYTISITVSGRNNVKVDSNIEDINSEYEVQTSADLTMDAHPDVRVFRIAGSAKNGITSLATVEIIDESDRSYNDAGFNATWLKVSPVNLYRHQVKQGAGGAMQQSSATALFVRTKYVPHKSWRAANSGKNWGWDAVIGSDTDDDMLSFDKATHRMCYKITAIPFANQSAVSFQEILLYSDEYTGAGSRSAKVKVTYDDGAGFVDTEIFTVSQQGAIVGANISIENTEESGILIAPGLPSTLQNISEMQWGHTTLLNTDDVNRYSFGAYNTALTTYSAYISGSGTNNPSWSVDQYRTPMWGYSGAAITSYTGGSSGAPYFNPTIGIGSIHPIYNSSAARYCHEKNRDHNGDGIIDQSETFWYLPSFADLWANKASLSSINAPLWTSSEENDTHAWVLNPNNNSANSVAKTLSYRVRCVRGAGAPLLGQATIASREADKTKISLLDKAGAVQFDASDPNGAGLTWTVTSSMPSWLTLKATSAGTTGNASLTGIGSKTGGAGYYAYATDNTGVVRTATITLTRAGQPALPARQITVIQAALVQPGGFSDILYFAADGKLQCGRIDTDFNRDNLAFFQFGSVVGFINNNDAWNPSHVKFNPVYPGKGYAYSSIPRYNNDVPTSAGVEGWISDTWHTGDRVKQGKGDPCKLVGLTAAEVNAMTPSAINSYNSGWRLPTTVEQCDFCGLSGAVIQSFPATTFPCYANSSGAPTTTDGNAGAPARAYFPIGGGTMASQTAGRTFNSSGTYLPAAGWRDTDSKEGFVGSVGLYWTGTLHSTTIAYSLSFASRYLNAINGNYFANGISVRCVRQ